MKFRALDILPPQCQRRLNSCPQAGDGVHDWIGSTALSLANYLDDPRQIVQLLLEYSSGCGRHVPAREVNDAVNSAMVMVQGEQNAETSDLSRPKWPELHPGLKKRADAEEFTLADLRCSSPVVCFQADPLLVLNRLFSSEDLVCLAADIRSPVTKPLQEAVPDLRQMRLVVPSPMSSRSGLTKTGQPSARCLSNVGPVRFLVVEFDSGSFDEQAGYIRFLSQYAPLALVVNSGSKSLHGWFNLQDWSEEDRRHFFELGVMLGADKATWCPCQMVRCPFGRRENGNLQDVVFFDPSVL